MRTYYCFLLFLIFAIWTGSANAQNADIEVIPHQPSLEAYDLLKDSKGYLWIGHNWGVSRYDGATFINLHHPLQNSRSITDLLEDKQGRIWCHNFSGQIFYIENLKLHLLTQYKYEKELDYPRMTICGDELIATSGEGLFVYNLLTGQSTSYPTVDAPSSLVRVGNKVIFYEGGRFYCYMAGKPITLLTTTFNFPKDQGVLLQKESSKDTFYLVTNPIGVYYKLTLMGHVLTVHSTVKASAFINTISVDNGRTWVNTKQNSFTTDSSELITAMNISDVIEDKERNRWMSSLKKGLCVQYNTQNVGELDHPLFLHGDDVRNIHNSSEGMFLGTANGRLYKMDSSRLHFVLSIPKKAGIIEHIAFINKDELLLAASIGLYYFHRKTKLLRQIIMNNTVKDIAVHEGMIYLATPSGIKPFTLARMYRQQLPIIWSDSTLGRKIRCRSLAFLGDSLIAAYNNGVYVMYRNQIQPLFYKQRPIYASTIKVAGSKVVIGTYNQGLLILENGTLRNLTEKDGLASNVIGDIKIIDGTIWLVYSDRFQQLNQASTQVQDYAFPFSKMAGVSDFGIWNNRFYVTSSEGIYSMPVAKLQPTFINATYIDRILVNGKENNTSRELHHNENFLQFQVSTPYFSPYSHILYQYRIKNAPDSAWQRGASGQTAFTIAALEPGSYDFEVVATDESRRIVSSPAEYHFEILPPWYQRLVFKIGLGVLVAGSAFYLVWLYYRRRLRKQRQEYEKLLVIQAERQRISSEIHDDVGAGLSAVRLLTELTRNKLPDTEARQEVGKIHASLSELSYKMREVIWSLNADNDNLENLLYYLRRQARQLFENSPIDLQITFPAQDIPDIVISGEKRRHIYLAVKEALHNSLKHSEATTCELSIRIEGRLLRITVVDDGKGFVPLKKESASNGLNNMKRRIQEMNGQLEIWSQEKTVVAFRIPLTEKHA